MPKAQLSDIAPVVSAHESSLLAEWMSVLRESGVLQTGRIKEQELQTQARQLLDALRSGLSSSHLHDDPLQAAKSILPRFHVRALHRASRRPRPRCSCSHSSSRCSTP